MQLLCILLLSAGLVVAVHHEGDFIHTSKRIQLKQRRTQWHDVIEHYCPRFGEDRTVAIPLHKPKDSDTGAITDYRIQLSFDGDRFVTPWVRVMGRSTITMPVLHVTLRSAGDELRGIKAQAYPVNDDFLIQNPAMYEEWRNSSAWPKHLLVVYAWDAAPDIDFDAALYVLLGLGLAVTLIISITNLAGVQSKLAAFMREVVSEQLDPLLGPGGVLGPHYGSGSNGPAHPAHVKRGSHVE